MKIIDFKINHKRLIVFVSRKLISYDSILPFLFEFKKCYPQLKLEIWFPDFSTYSVIKKNIFLFNCGKDIAEFHTISSAHFSGIRKIFNTLKVFIKLNYIILTAVFFRTSFIHFKLLDSKPFSILKFINKKNTFLAENDAYGYNQLMYDLKYLKHAPMKVNNKNINFLQFSEAWWEKKNNFNTNKKFLYYGLPKQRSIWMEHVKNVSNDYMKDQFAEYKIPYQSNIIPIMLGYFGGLLKQTSKDAQEILLIETLEVLSELKSNLVILLKPHIISDLVVVNKIIKQFPKIQIFITYLHPMILASHSNFVIANDYSTTLNDFKIMECKTIEYASYNEEALKITSGGSSQPHYVDYFINKDVLLLKHTLKQLLKNTVKKKVLTNSEDKKNIFNKILKM